MPRRTWLVGLASLAALAAGLRLWGSVSAPIVRHPDEFRFPVIIPLQLFSGDFNPHDFAYPTLHPYLLGLVYSLCFVVQKLFGAGWSRVEFAAYYIFWDSNALVFWARAMSVAFATATVIWVGALARRLYGPELGIAAAALLTVNVIHVRQAALASVDAALAFWCLGAVWAAVRLLEREGMRDYVLAGLLVGLAAGTKYPAAVLGGAVAAAHLLAGRSLGDWRLWLSGATAALTFVTTSPYIVLDYETFLQHFLFEVGHASRGRGVEDAAWYQVFFNLRHGLGPLGILLLLAGLGRALYHRERAALVVAAAFLLFYGSISWGKLTFARYTLPLLPLLAVLAAGGLGLVRHRVGQRILLALLVAYPLYGSVRVAHLMGREDTRLAAQRYIEEHVPAGTVCCNFGGWAGDVQLRTFEDQLWRLERFESSFGYRALTEVMDFLAASNPARPFYFFVARPGLVLSRANREFERGTWELVAERSCAYVLLHRHPLAYSQVDAAFAAALAERGERVRVWRPEGLAESAPLYDTEDAYYLPLADFGPLRQPGPEIELWRLAEYPEGAANVWGAREIFARTYAVWAHVVEYNRENNRDRDNARVLLYKALALEAGDPQIYGVIGNRYYNLQDFDGALVAWTKAIELNPTFGPALHNVALLYQYHLDDPKAAIPYWHRAIDAGEDTVEALSSLAEAYIFIGNQPQASRWRTQLLERYPDSPEAQEIRERF